MLRGVLRRDAPRLDSLEERAVPGGVGSLLDPHPRDFFAAVRGEHGEDGVAAEHGFAANALGEGEVAARAASGLLLVVARLPPGSGAVGGAVEGGRVVVLGGVGLAPPGRSSIASSIASAAIGPPAAAAAARAAAAVEPVVVEPVVVEPVVVERAVVSALVVRVPTGRRRSSLAGTPRPVVRAPSPRSRAGVGPPARGPRPVPVPAVRLVGDAAGPFAHAPTAHRDARAPRREAARRPDPRVDARGGRETGGVARGGGGTAADSAASERSVQRRGRHSRRDGGGHCARYSVRYSPSPASVGASGGAPRWCERARRLARLRFWRVRFFQLGFPRDGLGRTGQVESSDHATPSARGTARSHQGKRERARDTANMDPRSR